jgi:hemolysin activation/secretion protein
VVLGLLVCLHAVAAHAQGVAPSQITPPTLRPEPAPTAPALGRPEPARPETRGDTPEDALQVRVGEVQIEGGLPALADETAALVQALQGRQLTLGDIRRHVLALEQAYGQRGFFLVRVVLPPQRLVDGGPLQLRVVDGVIESLDTAALPESQRAVVERTLAPLIDRPALTLAEAERRLALAGESAGLRLRSTLAAGSTPGATRLLLDGEHRLADASLSLGNGQPRTLGTADLQLTGSLNSALGQGERLYLTLGSGRAPFDAESRHGFVRLVGLGLVLPVGIEGASLNPELTRTVTRPAPEPDALRTRGRLQRSALRALLPLDATGLQVWTAQIGLEQIDQRQTAIDFGVDLSRDRYRVLRAGLDRSFQFDESRAALSLGLAKGLGGRDAAEAEAEGVPLSRLGAGPRFGRFNLAVRWSRPLGADHSLRLFASSQSSLGDALLVPEQFALSGPEAVSGYTPGSLAVDTGVALRAEVSRHALVSFDGRGLSFAPYAFAATGHGRLIEPSALERARVHAGSAGLGLRIAAPGGGLSVELARRLGHPDGPADTRRWHMQARLGWGL